jgi:hypothetical protein
MDFTNDERFENVASDDAVMLEANESPSSSDFARAKIPMKRIEIQPVISKTQLRQKQAVKKSKLSELIVIHKRLEHERAKDESKMRQTKIDEFFKPRASISVGATSRGTTKKRIAG